MYISNKKTQAKFEFYIKQLADAMSPSNFALTNPEVIRESLETNGASLLKGFQNLLRDLDGKKILNIQTLPGNKVLLTYSRAN